MKNLNQLRISFIDSQHRLLLELNKDPLLLTALFIKQKYATCQITPKLLIKGSQPQNDCMKLPNFLSHPPN